MAILRGADPQGALAFLMEALQSGERMKQTEIANAQTEFGTLLQLIGKTTTKSDLAGKEKFLQRQYNKLKAMDTAYDNPMLGMLADHLEEGYNVREGQLQSFETAANTVASFLDTPAIDLGNIDSQVQKAVDQDKIDNPGNWVDSEGNPIKNVNFRSNVKDTVMAQSGLETGKFAWNDYDDFSNFMKHTPYQSVYNHLNERTMFYDEQIAAFEQMGFHKGKNGKIVAPPQFPLSKEHPDGQTYYKLYGDLIRERDKWENTLAAIETRTTSDGKDVIINKSEFEKAVTLDRGEFMKAQEEAKKMYGNLYGRFTTEEEGYRASKLKIQNASTDEFISFLGQSNELKESGAKTRNDAIDWLDRKIKEAQTNASNTSRAYSYWSGFSPIGEGEEGDIDYSDLEDFDSMSGNGSYDVTSKSLDYFQNPVTGDETVWELAANSKDDGFLGSIQYNYSENYGVDYGSFIDLENKTWKKDDKEEQVLFSQLELDPYFEGKYYKDAEDADGSGDDPIFINEKDRDDFQNSFNSIRSLYWNYSNAKAEGLNLNQFYDLIEGSKYGLDNVLEKIISTNMPGSSFDAASNDKVFNEILKPRIDGYHYMMNNQDNINYLNSKEFKELKEQDKKAKIREMMMVNKSTGDKNQIDINLSAIGNVENISLNWLEDTTIFTKS